MEAMTGYDAMMLHALGVRADELPAELAFTEVDYRLLIGQLRQDLAASEGDVRRLSAVCDGFAAMEKAAQLRAEAAERRAREAMVCAWVAAMATALAGVLAWL